MLRQFFDCDTNHYLYDKIRNYRCTVGKFHGLPYKKSKLVFFQVKTLQKVVIYIK